MNRFQTLIFYFILFYISAFFADRYQKFMSSQSFFLINHTKQFKSKRRLLILCIVLPIILMQGLRLNVGTDYQNYYWRVVSISSGNIQVIRSYLSQPLFLAECYLVGKVFRNPLCFFFFDSVIMNIILFKVFDHYRNKINMKLAYMLYYSIVFMMFVNIERQAVSCLIVWYAYRYIQEKNFKKYIFTILLACSFHTSAIFFLIIYFIVKTEKNKKIMEVALFVGVIAFVLFSSNITRILNIFMDIDADSVYINKTHQQMHFSALLYLFMFYIPNIVMMYLPRRNKNGFSFFIKNGSFFFKSFKSNVSNYLIYVCDILTIAFVLSEAIVSYGSRFGYYTYFGLIIGVSSSYNNLKNKLHKHLFFAYFTIASIVYFIRIYYIIGQAQVFPYRSIFEII